MTVPADGKLHKVISPDGTSIAARVWGDGPPLVLVHGTTADHSRWFTVSDELAAHFTLYGVDRRGRGSSGDAETYAIEREFDDVAALVDSIGGPVFLLGHSFGALCSLEAATRTANVDRLVLYEPPIPTGIEVYPIGSIEQVEQLVSDGKREEALIVFMRDVVLMTESDLERLRSLPAWQARIAAARTLAREERASEGYAFDRRRFASVTVPTLLLLGGASPEFLTRGTRLLSDTLPNVRLSVMPEQAHAAMDTGPDLFLKAVLGFLLER